MLEQKIDEEAQLLEGPDPIQWQLDQMTKHLLDEMRSQRTTLMAIDNEIRDSIQSLSDTVVAMRDQLTDVVTKLSNPVAPPTPRVAIAPRSSIHASRNSSISRARPSTSRDRSRSPIGRRNSPLTKPTIPHKAQIRCTFCNSVVHLSRNCTVVKSLTKRLKIMPHDDCPKCFRKRNETHSPKCEPDVCRRECMDESGRPLRHMDWFCPRNPSLDE